MKQSLAALVAALAVAALSAAAASADELFEDPAGDNQGAAPDITTVAVSNTPDGNITFQITIANYEALPPLPSARAHVSLFLDLDKNESTGEFGNEAVAVFVNILVNKGAVNFWRWDGSAMVDVPETNMSSSLSGGVLTFTINWSELLNVTGFAFWVQALTFVDGVSPRFDYAPDGAPPWTYDLVFPPPPPPTLSATKPVGTPTRPVAGRKFTVRSLVTRSDTGEAVTAGSVRCRARVGTARLRAEGRFRAGRAQCVMAVPPKARGKTLRGSMTVRAAGASVSKPYSFRIV